MHLSKNINNFYTTFLFSSILFLLSCGNSEEFTINGKAQNADKISKVYLFAADSTGNMRAVDSTFLNEDKEFKLKYSSVQPRFYQLIIGENSYMIIAKNGNKINFETDFKNPSKAYEAKGSEEEQQITSFNKILDQYSQSSSALAKDFTYQIQADTLKRDSLIEAFTKESKKLSKPFMAKAYAFIQENKDALTSFFAANIILGVDPVTYELPIINYAEEVKSKFPDNRDVQLFVKQMELQKKIAIGAQAPDISLPDTNGNEKKLSAQKGKYVLIDFWASWCLPCREENPNIVKMYQQYKDKGFTVFGVSLDDNVAAWKKAIEDDQLSWTHVSELKQWDSMAAKDYQVNAIPASFILNKEGKIIAKNLRGDELAAFLSRTLN